MGLQITVYHKDSNIILIYVLLSFRRQHRRQYPKTRSRNFLSEIRIASFCSSCPTDYFYLLLQKGNGFVSEPAILVKRKSRPNQIWSMEKLENKIIDMREMYEERKSSGQPMMVEDTDSWVCCCCMAFADLLTSVKTYDRFKGQNYMHIDEYQKIHGNNYSYVIKRNVELSCIK